MDCSLEWCFLATNVWSDCTPQCDMLVSQQCWSTRDYHPSDGIGTCVEITACQIWVIWREKWSHSKFFEKQIPWVWNSRLSCPPAMDNGTETGKPMSVHPWRLPASHHEPNTEEQMGHRFASSACIKSLSLLIVNHCKAIFPSNSLQFSDYPFMAPVWAKRSLIIPMRFWGAKTNPIP